MQEKHQQIEVGIKTRDLSSLEDEFGDNELAEKVTQTDAAAKLRAIAPYFEAQHPEVDLAVKIGFRDFVVNNGPIELSPINAIANQGELVLVFADDATTTSTFLKAIKGEYQSDNKFVNQLLDPSILIYNDEVDVHFPHLNVDQTLQFAIDCKFPIDDDCKQEIKSNLLSIFGLSHLPKTIVGNDYVRGVSGGERKRISIIESLIANGLVYLWDNSTKGLDSSTALEFINSLYLLKELKRTHFVGINQISEKMIVKFDKILLFIQNKQIFYGTIAELLQFLSDCGFNKPSGTTDIEFINNILGDTTLNINELESKWFKSSYYKNLISQLDSNANLAAQYNPPKNKFQISILKQFQYCFRRSVQRLKGDSTYYIAQTSSTLIQSLVIGSLFYGTPRSTVGSFSRGSIMFFSLLFFVFISLAEMPTCFVQRPIVNKQRRLFFYHPAADTFAKIIIDMIFKAGINIMFTIPLYFLSGLQRNGARFFIFLLFLFISTENMSLLFQGLGFLSPTIPIANALGGLLLLSIAMYASYVIYLKQMHPWFKWISYINPIRYGFEAMLSNELFNINLNCTDSIIPSGPSYDNVPMDFKVCGWQGATLGNNYVEGKSYLKDAFTYSYSHTWRNFGIMIGFFIFFFIVNLLASEFITVKYVYKKPISIKQEHEPELEIDPETLQEKNDLKFDNEISLSWENVEYTVNNLKLLNKVSGYVSSGYLTALMGESGAGKTTLLNALSRRVDGGVIEGEVLVNGKPINHEAFKRNTGYVQQQDVHVKELTVKESLVFSSRLRSDGDINYVEQVLKKLRLPAEKKVKDLSPKDQKMLSIGVELVTKPVILFLDEPTSGLENDSALAIVKILKELSESGQAILCTIHQPSTAIFKYFQKLLLLKKGGEVVYFGDNNSKMIDYFVSNGAESLEENENPAEYILKVVGAGAGATTDKDWAQLWNNSAEQNTAKNEILHIVKENNNSSSKQGLFSQVHERNYLFQMSLVLERTSKQIYRDYAYLSAKFGLMIIGGLYIGFTFYKTKHTVIGLQNVMFAMFMILALSSPLVQQIQAKAAESKSVYLVREHKSNTFHWSILVLAQTLAEIPFVFIGATLLYVCFYFTIGVNDSSSSSGVFYLNYLLFSLYYLTFGLWLSYSAKDLETSHVFVAFLFSFTVSFCGVMQPKDLMPKFWLFMYRVSPYTYLVDNLVSSALHERKVTCATGEYALVQAYNGMNCGDYLKDYIAEKGGYVLYPESTFVCSYCVYDKADEFLKVEHFSYDNIWRNFGIVWVYIVFNFVAMIYGFYLFQIRNVSLIDHLRKLKLKLLNK